MVWSLVPHTTYSSFAWLLMICLALLLASLDLSLLSMVTVALDVVDAAGPALGALELAVGPPWRDSGVSPLLSPPFRAA
jgi:hypothetical protein